MPCEIVYRNKIDYHIKRVEFNEQHKIIQHTVFAEDRYSDDEKYVGADPMMCHLCLMVLY